MASGNSVGLVAKDSDLPLGAVITSSGRVSAVSPPGVPSVNYPFSTQDLVSLDDTLTYCSRATGVRFAVYIGDLGSDTHAGAKAALASISDAHNAVLIAVSPNHKAVEVLSGSDLAKRVNDRVAQLGVTAALASFADGDLIDGLISAVRVITSAIVSP